MAILPEDFSNPSPAQVMEFAVAYAELLRSLFNHPQFKYLEPPTAAICKIDGTTPPALIFASDFVEKTYIEYVIPWLPAGASRKCRVLGNPWAFADPDYRWEWEWDAAAGAMRSAADGAAVEFPRFSDAKAKEMIGDLYGRGFLAKKAILENGTDPKATLMMGGPFDFGAEVKQACEKLD